MRGLATLVLSLALTATALADAPPDAAAQAELDAAKANIALMTVRPKMLDAPEPEFPDSEKALGHHGEVLVRGVLGADGKLSHLSVTKSSLAPALDAQALSAAAAALYEPARNAEGAPIPVLIAQSYKFDNYRSDVGVGAAQYMCGQFVLDMDWWKQAHASANYRDHEFYTMMRGLGVIARMGQGKPLKPSTIETNEAFDQRWQDAIAGCRAKPDARFADMMKPEGDYILNIEKRSARK